MKRSDAVAPDHVFVKVRRMDIARFTRFQLAASACIVVGVMGRRIHWFPLSICVAAYVIALVLWFRSYRWFGRCEIAFAGNHLVIGTGGPAVHPGDLRMWVLGEGEVRLYTADFKFIWRFLVSDSELEVFRAKLTKSFGRPRALVRRGSRRARAMFIGLTVVAGAAAGFGIGSGLNALGLVAILVTGLAFSSFMIASLKVLGPAT